MGLSFMSLPIIFYQKSVLEERGFRPFLVNLGCKFSLRDCSIYLEKFALIFMTIVVSKVPRKASLEA